MKRTLVLSVEPTMHQASIILTRIEQELVRRGALIRTDDATALRFDMPAPWRVRHAGFLALVSSGRVRVGAGAGGPWRVRYELGFRLLLVIACAAAIALVLFGLNWSRGTLVAAIALLGLCTFVIPYMTAGWRFNCLIRACARDVLCRRDAARPIPVASTTNGKEKTARG